MFNKTIVYEALKRSEQQDPVLDSQVSLLIHDVFGGEILKTHKKSRWHFYNRINGERIDFTRSRKYEEKFEDIPATPDETHDYVDQIDYTNFFMRFVKAFEEIVGLDKIRAGLA